MEISQVFGFLIIAYAFIRFLPQKGRFITASITISVVLLLSFSYKNDITDYVIKLFNSGNIFFYEQMISYLFQFIMVEITLSFEALKSEGAIEFSLFIDFVKILRDSIKLVSKSGKLLGLVTILSLVVPSIIFSIFMYLYTYLINRMAKSSSPIILILQLATFVIVFAAFVFACSVILQLSAIATISISADHKKRLSLKDLFSRMKRTWRRQLSNSFSGSRNPTRFELVIGAIANAQSVTTIFNASSTGIRMGFVNPASAVWPLSSVVSVVEECTDGGEAEKKAQGLVEGERVHGFMLKLLFLVALVYGMIVEDSGPEIDLTRGLLRLNSLILGRIMWCILHSLLYFRCKKVNDSLGIGKEFIVRICSWWISYFP